MLSFKNQFFRNLAIIAAISTSIVFTISCKDDNAGNEFDNELYNMAINSDGFVWYKKTDALLKKSAASGHSQPFLRTRYNSIAAMHLDSTGKVARSAKFLNESLIVKELMIDANTIELYAILYKDSNSEFADANGWVWSYIYANGEVKISSADKGGDCISCHAQSDNIDYTLMNKYFP